MIDAVLRFLRLKPPCAHEWRDIYGDEITWMNARSVCKKCGKRSHRLMNVRSGTKIAAALKEKDNG